MGIPVQRNLYFQVAKELKQTIKVMRDYLEIFL